MLGLLARIFIRQGEGPPDRTAYGRLTGIVGVALNLLLCAGKLFAGRLSGSIAITADAFNSLSDAISSLVTLIGFQVAAKKADAEHPFGHGRFEYVAGLIVSLAILLMGFELAREAVRKILAPQPVSFDLRTALILALSILVKLYMAAYNRALARRLDSVAMRATAIDSLSDALATAGVLAASLAAHIWGLAIDGWAGAAVACLVLWAGWRAAKETISPLLGNAPAPALIRAVREIVLAHPEVVGIHDLLVHDYGVGRLMISLHAEVPADGDLIAMHDAIDAAERELMERLHCQAVIHMDPVERDGSRLMAVREAVEGALRQQLDPRITIHDFRMVAGPTHTNLIFDAVLPPALPLSDREARERVAQLAQALDGSYFAVVTIDRSYVGGDA